MRQQELTDDDGLPIGVILWRLRRALAVGAICGLVGGLLYWATRSDTMSFVGYLDTPSLLNSSGAVSPASAKDTALSASLTADRIESQSESIQITVKEADRTSSLIRVEITLPAASDAPERAAAASEKLLSALTAEQEPLIAPIREGIGATITRLRAQEILLTRTLAEPGTGDSPVPVVGIALLQQSRAELIEAELQLAAIHPSRMVSSLTGVPAERGAAQTLGILFGGAFVGALAGLAVGWLGSEIAAARRSAGR